MFNAPFTCVLFLACLWPAPRLLSVVTGPEYLPLRQRQWQKTIRLTFHESPRQRLLFSKGHNWVDWNVWFQSTLHLNGFVTEFKARGGDGEVLSRIYGLIGTTVTGNAAKVFSTNGVVGDGYKTWVALKDAFGGSRNLEITHKVKAAITERKKPESSMVDYISDKRQLWQIIESAFQKENGTKDWEKLWEFVKKVALIVNVDNTDMSDFLIMEFSRTESLGKSMAMDAIESSLINFHDSFRLRHDDAEREKKKANVALSAESDNSKGGKGRGKGNSNNGGRGLGWYSGGFQGYGYGGRGRGKGYGEWWYQPNKNKANNGGRGKGKGKDGKGGKGKGKAKKGKGGNDKDADANAFWHYDSTFSMVEVRQQHSLDEDIWWWSQGEVWAKNDTHFGSKTEVKNPLEFDSTLGNGTHGADVHIPHVCNNNEIIKPSEVVDKCVEIINACENACDILCESHATHTSMHAQNACNTSSTQDFMHAMHGIAYIFVLKHLNRP